MAKKDKKNEMNKQNKGNKKESLLVTKESFCAATAVFSLLAVLILFSRSSIFGDVGFAVFGFLTGLFGYLAYPIVLGTFYISVMGLIGKRLVQNRKLGFCVAMSVVSVMLVAHTAMTFSWETEGYLLRCFTAGEGESVFSITAAGLLGGLLVYGTVTLISNIGALLFFSALTAFFVYLCIAFAKRKAETEQMESVEKVKKAKKNKKAKETADSMPSDLELPEEQNIPNNQMNNGYGYSVPPMETYEGGGFTNREGYPSGLGYSAMPTVSQHPGVILADEAATAQDGQAGAYSPFAPHPNASDDSSRPYTDGREFLFGGSPEEIYRRNLIFDPKAKANNRPDFDPAQAGTMSGYTPSYTEAYEDSINNFEDVRPAKVVEDNPYGTQNSYGGQQNAYGGYPSMNEQPTPVVPDPTFTPKMEETPTPFIGFGGGRNEDVSFEENVEEDGEEEIISTPRRHDYMDVFSTANPNVFGRDSGIEHTGDENFTLRQGRLSDQEETEKPTVGFGFTEVSEPSPFDRVSRDEESAGRSGINLLDDDENEEENPYALRSDFEVNDRGSSRRGDDTLFEDRSSRFEKKEENTQDEILSSRRSVSDRTPAVAKPVEPPKPTPEPPKPRIIRPYVRVRLDDLDCRDIEPTANQEEVEETKANIISTLEDFKITGASIASVTFGPTVTRYNVTIPRSISPKKVVALDQSIAISLHSSGVNVYPNYEDGVVSIEVPNKERQFVQMGCMLSGDTFVNAKSSSLMFTMGKDVANRKIYGDITKMIHLLVAGSSGSGKSVFLGALIISLIYKYSPEELRLILIDPKKTEFVLYNNLPHLMINEIITDVPKTIQSLNWAIGEMNRRYGLFEQMSRAGTYVVNLDQYNAQMEKNKRLPKIVIIIDELADLMLSAKKEIEDRIQNLTQKARAAGIHLIVATQRPSTDVITGVIKSNLPTRVAFYVATDVDSRVILDQTGAQKLLGKGDFLYTMPGLNSPQRVQSAFISPEESQKVVNFIKNNNEAYYDEEATAFINNSGGNGGDIGGSSDGNETIDPMCIEALKFVIQSGSASISMIQRKCSAGYNRAGKIIEWMEEKGYISAFDGAKARKVLITQEEFERLYGEW